MILPAASANAATSTLRALQGFEGSAEDVASSGTPTCTATNPSRQSIGCLCSGRHLKKRLRPIKDAETPAFGLITLLVCLLGRALGMVTRMVDA